MPMKWTMFGAAKAPASMQGAQAAQLGTALVALRLEGTVSLPPGCVELVFSAAGQARRAPSARAGTGEIACAYHPGPYETAFAPFASAPEIGLRLRYLADAADPRVAQQRFDLFLFSEAGTALTVEALHGAVAGAVREALAQGMLELPACTTLDEWHAFRAGINELLYMRFGLTVDDCVPVDLGAACDYAHMLRARSVKVAAAACMPPGGANGDGAGAAMVVAGAQAGGTPGAMSTSTHQNHTAGGAAEGTAGKGAMQDAVTRRVEPLLGTAHGGLAAAGHSGATAATAPAAATDGAICAGHSTLGGIYPAASSIAGADPAMVMTLSPRDAAGADAHALRRLFLELPAWSAGLRALALPAGQAPFTARRDVLQRCALAALDVSTMPALAWAAPDRPLAPAIQAQRAAHSVAAAQVLDQLWALLARWRVAAQDSASSINAHAPLLDDADRLTANLAFHLAGRRAIVEERWRTDQRREPQL